MSLQVGVSIAYKDVFDDYDKVDVVKLISGLPSISCLKVICHFLAQMHTIERDQVQQKRFFNEWIKRLPVAVQTAVIEFKEKIDKKPNSEYNFLNNISASILIDLFLLHFNKENSEEKLSEGNELNLFKAYLWSSQSWTDRTNPVIEKIGKITSESDLIEVLLPCQLPYQEILEFHDFRMQFIKSVFYFKFCEKNKDFKGYLELFLNEYKLENWQKYLINVLSIYIRKFEGKKGVSSILHVTDDYPQVINFLDQYCLDVNSYKSSKDFTYLRSKPILRLNKNEFLFLNINFIVDKLFQGIQFDFGRILAKNKAQFKGSTIKGFDQFKSIYGTLFSETELFYEIMRYTFEFNKYKLLSGDEIKAHVEDGEPDFYIRDKAKLYLFEYKDVLINAEIKHSYDYETIKGEIFKKLVENNTGSSKGVTQLVNSLEKYKNGEYKKFDSTPFNDSIIYPIIVCNDFSFNIRGINYILNRELQTQLKAKKLDTLNVRPLILINLDTLIKFQDLFRNKALKLNNCFNEFYEFLRNKSLFDRVGSFDSFMHDKTFKLKYESPLLMMKEVEKMIPNATTDEEAKAFWE